MYNRPIRIGGISYIFSINKDKGETHAIRKIPPERLEDEWENEVVRVTCDKGVDNFDPTTGIALSLLKMLVESGRLQGCPNTWGAFKRWARNER